jgi:hypothetical protein
MIDVAEIGVPRLWLSCMREPGCEDTVTLPAGLACIDMHGLLVTCFRKILLVEYLWYEALTATSSVPRSHKGR